MSNKVTITGSGNFTVSGTLNNDGGSLFGCTDGGSSCCMGGSCSLALPIELMAFDAKSNLNSVEVTWSTASEQNNDFFSIERSLGGRKFELITTQSGAGTSFDVLNYTYQDNRPYSGISYYRLKQTDYDGTTETFKVVSVEFYGETKPLVVTQYDMGRIIVQNYLDEESTAILFDNMGRIVNKTSLIKGENTIGFAASHQMGIYILRVVNSQGRELASERVLLK